MTLFKIVTFNELLDSTMETQTMGLIKDFEYCQPSYSVNIFLFFWGSLKQTLLGSQRIIQLLYARSKVMLV